MSDPSPTRIYFDYAATAPLRPAARIAMIEALDAVGNASSLHQEGQHARALIDTARRVIADGLGVHPGWVVFTSGGTEANNLALRGFAAKNPSKRMLVGATEHDCVLHTAQALGATMLPVDTNGLVKMEILAAELAKGDVGLVSLMHANNETGILHPITEAAQLCRRYGVFLHTDAVQSFGHTPINFNNLGVHMLTCTAHKLGGPKGAGALIVDPAVPMASLLIGGGQERNRRAGTENVPAISGFGAAVEDYLQHEASELALAHQIGTVLRQNLPQFATEIAPNAPRCNHLLLLHLPHLKGEDAVIKLDLSGISASQGSACSSGRVQPSHVLQAMNILLTNQQIRLSWGWLTTPEEAATVAHALQNLAPNQP